MLQKPGGFRVKPLLIYCCSQNTSLNAFSILSFLDSLLQGSDERQRSPEKKPTPAGSGGNLDDDDGDVVVLVGSGGEHVHLIEDFVQEFLGGQVG